MAKYTINRKIFFLISIPLLSIIFFYINYVQFDKIEINEIQYSILKKRGKSMGDNNFDYSVFDRPEVLNFLFHPRPDTSPPSKDIGEMAIPVEEDVSIGAKLFIIDEKLPTILFFHGNGEIASDYDDLGPIYNKLGINFIPVDYRGYGRSTGTPTVSAMMKDCHAIYNYINNFIKDNNFSGPLIIMGRSLGSASALELAANYSSEIDGLIIESGFANAIRRRKPHA